MKKGTLILMAMLLALSACGTSTTETTVAATPVPEMEASTDMETQWEPLEKKTYGGKEVNFLVRSEWAYEFMVEEETGANVSDAIFRRNITVEDTADCRLHFIDMTGDWEHQTTFTNTIHNSVLAGDNAYDIIAGYQAVLPYNIVNKDLLNLYNIPHLTLDAPWWSQEGIETLTYNGICYMVGGDIAVSLLESISCMFFNKQLALDHNLPDIYEIVRAGAWTHDKQAELIEGIYQDLNGDGIRSEEDLYGLITQHNGIRPYVVAYDTPTISKEGKIIWMTEHTVDVVESLVDFFGAADAWYIQLPKEAQQILTENRALLINTTLGTASLLRDMDNDFGIIPYPKYDGNQENYMTTTSNEVSMMCVPVTAGDLDMSGYILETMCRHSTDTVADAFYNVALQGKYARDEESLEMIRLMAK